jgi:hypothetical protein
VGYRLGLFREVFLVDALVGLFFKDESQSHHDKRKNCLEFVRWPQHNIVDFAKPVKHLSRHNPELCFAENDGKKCVFKKRSHFSRIIDAVENEPEHAECDVVSARVDCETKGYEDQYFDDRTAA